MTMLEFKRDFDKPHAIVLLEGKRNVLDTDKAKLVELGKLLCRNTKHILFRSGNADGADHYFSVGVAEVDKSRLQVITPYKGHRDKYNLASETIALDAIDISAEPEVIYQSKQNKKTSSLVDQYVKGKRDRYSIKAAYILRDTVKVLGTSSTSAATFGIFYDDLDKPGEGGTGHTMNVCVMNNVPFIDQNVWFNWI